MTQGDEVPLAERRATGSGERRRYNRRTAPEPGTPPYYEIFDRIASALEAIAGSLGAAPAPYPQGPTPVRPRQSSESDAAPTS